jgi:hypothetical protein
MLGQQADRAAQLVPVAVEVAVVVDVVVLVAVTVAVLVLPSAVQTPGVQLDVSLQAELSVTGCPPVQVMVVAPELSTVPVAIVAPEAFLNVIDPVSNPASAE